MSLEYIIEKHTHGWLVCAAPGQRGVTMSALAVAQPLFPANAVIDAGIARHHTVWAHETAVFCVTTKSGSELWRKDIAAAIAEQLRAPHDLWWYGTDVGTSSAGMFAVLCPEYLRASASEYGNRTTPRDADDLGRCLRLLEAIPEWRERLNEVAEAYPDTAWPRIIARWVELEAAEPKTQNYILNECAIPTEEHPNE